MQAMLGDRRILRIFAKHDPYWNTGHLGEVAAEMEKIGPPSIRVVNWRDEFFAVEGSHRLAAAHALGLVPNVIIEHPERHDPCDESFWDSCRDKLPHYAWMI